MKRMGFFMVFICVMNLPGCAQYYWKKSGAGQAEFNRDSYECQMEAARVFPTQIVVEQLSAGFRSPSSTDCITTNAGYGRSASSCTTTPGLVVPPVTNSVDVNSENRARSAMQCLYSRGWQRYREN